MAWNMGEYAKLESVGAVVDRRGLVAPMLANGEPDHDAGWQEEHDASREWLDRLSWEDSLTIRTRRQSDFAKLSAKQQKKVIRCVELDSEVDKLDRAIHQAISDATRDLMAQKAALETESQEIIDQIPESERLVEAWNDAYDDIRSELRKEGK